MYFVQVKSGFSLTLLLCRNILCNVKYSHQRPVILTRLYSQYHRTRWLNLIGFLRQTIKCNVTIFRYHTSTYRLPSCLSPCLMCSNYALPSNWVSALNGANKMWCLCRLCRNFRVNTFRSVLMFPSPTHLNVRRHDTVLIY